MARALHAVALVVVFVATLIVMLRDGGSSPIAWMDTFNDEREVRQCLTEDACTLVGVSTSVPGLVHAVGWLQWRTALAWLGVDIDTAHVAVLVLSALGAVLVFHLASRLGGVLAGVVACWIFLDRIDPLLRLTALHNSSVLLFLGAVFLLACTAAVERPGAASVALAALVAAVLANVHVVGVACGASVAWVALLAPRHRWLLASFGLAVFAIATVAVAPGTWSHNVATLLVRPAGHPVVPEATDNPLLVWVLVGVGAWALASLVRMPAFRAYRRRAHGAIAVLMPLLAAFAIAPYVGLYAEPKYLLHAKAAAAVAATLPVALLVRPLWRAAPRVGGAVDVLLPFALAAVLLDPGMIPGMARGPSAADDPTPTLADLGRAAAILHQQYGWDARRTRAGLRTEYGVTAQVGLAQAMAPLGPAAAAKASSAEPSSLTPSTAPRDASLLVIANRDLPAPLPPDWHVVRHSPQATTALIPLRSVIDWSAFEVCTLPEGDASWTCAASRFDSASDDAVEPPGMPPPGRAWRGRIRISAMLRPLAADESVAIFMPRIAIGCGGRILATPAHVQRAADERHATIAGPTPAGAPARLELEWAVGAPECGVTTYDGGVPWVVEGDAAAVRTIETILRRRET